MRLTQHSGRSHASRRRTPWTRLDRHSRSIALVLAALAPAFALLLPQAAGAAAPQYAALGDSYTSAPGILPLAPASPPQCGQSARNYPHLIATALKLSLTDASCAGAKTENFTNSQSPGQGPQFDALHRSTKVVSVSMGGNDEALFVTLLAGCSVADAGRPNVGAPCESQYEAFVNEAFAQSQAPREAALAQIHRHSPKAKLFVVGYPEVMPSSGYCPAAIPWTTGDLKWFREVTVRINNALGRWAQAHGATFVDTFTPSKGHNACEALGTRWIEPLIGSLTGVPLHPNVTGVEHEALDVGTAMKQAGIR
ncbi:MAG TPA: SGNH/GDSL hydrolase family protein [Solirubrobacteraceae bacterium]|nr:SGNH/GDSL hydrolase family protein [Solirubrobacteraceae bacterium]